MRAGCARAQMTEIIPSSLRRFSAATQSYNLPIVYFVLPPEKERDLSEKTQAEFATNISLIITQIIS